MGRTAPARATRERLIEVAAALFPERGRDGVSVRDVCAAAGANVASVAYHFGGKEGLYLAVLRAGLEQMVAGVKGRLAHDEPDPARRLVRHVRAFAEVMLAPDAPAWATRLILVELARPTRALTRLIEEFMRP